MTYSLGTLNSSSRVVQTRWQGGFGRFAAELILLAGLLVLGFWFIVQFFSGTASLAVSSSHNTGGVAWWAHVGGFVIGMLLLAVMAPRRPRYDYSR